MKKKIVNNKHCPDCEPDNLCDYHRNPNDYEILTAKDFFPKQMLEQCLAWIRKSHHLDGCSYSRKLPLYSTCNCGRNNLVGAKRPEEKE